MMEVKKNIATLTYDGDGRRVKSEAYTNGILTETILFIGAHFEVKNGSEITKYYFAGASRIATRKYIVPQSNTLTYLLGDHLGSTSLTIDSATSEVIETRYKAWGEVRYTTPNKTLPTRNTFTGQFSYVADDATDLGNSGFGLMFYQSRFYDPALGRFAQADSIVPSGVQGMDRYAYVNNSPLVYVDPSGHMCSDPDDESSSGCDGNGSQPSNTNTLPLASNKTDPVGSLSAWGIKIKEMYQAWARQCNGWESDCTSYSTENFMVLILSFEFRTLNLDKNTHEAEDLAHAANHWFYMTCDYRTGPASGDCQGVSDNAIFNWVGAMESARRRYNAWKANISWQIDATGNIDLAKYVVDMIYTPLSIEWHRSSGNSWNGANDPVNRHPYAWANGYLFVHLPRDFIWAYPFGVKPDGDSAYLLTLLQTDSTPKR